MSYVDQKSGPSPTGLAGAVIVQAAIGAAIVMGLSVATTQILPAPPIDTWDIKDPVPPEPEPTPEPDPRAEQKPEVTTQPPITVPQPEITLDNKMPDIRTTETIFDGPIILDPRPEVDKPPVAPPPAFDAVSARPRNDPGAWLRDSDYRSSWVRREYAGIARFRLDIAATGKVTGCRIIGSTGHGELDAATCKLVQRRAKFEPARGTDGGPVTGSYVSSVRWQLPE